MGRLERAFRKQMKHMTWFWAFIITMVVSVLFCLAVSIYTLYIYNQEQDDDERTEVHAGTENAEMYDGLFETE